MRRKWRAQWYIPFGAGVFLLVVMGVFFYMRSVRIAPVPEISVRFSEDDTVMQEIYLFQREGDFYAFFPAYADLRNLKFESTDSNIVFVFGNHRFSTGETVDLTEAVGSMPLTILRGEGKAQKKYDLHIEQSANLAAMSIMTDSRSMEHIHEAKENREGAYFTCITGDGRIDSEGEAEIKCHGSASFGAEKKSYRVKFKRRTSVLGEELACYINVDSFVSMYLVDEITNEVDCNAFSAYYYYNGQDGLLYAGPAWDFDRALGNDNYGRGQYYGVNDFANGLPERLWLEESNAWVQQSAIMDSDRWGLTASGFIDTGDFAYNVDYVKWVFEKRFALIYDVVMNPESYCNVYIGDARSGRAVWVKRGETIPASELAYLAALYGCGGFALANGTPIWDEFPILHDIVVTPIAKGSANTEQKEPESKSMSHIIAVMGTSKNPGLLAQREILPQIEDENRRNTLRISRFSQRRYAAKEPL